MCLSLKLYISIVGNGVKALKYRGATLSRVKEVFSEIKRNGSFRQAVLLFCHLILHVVTDARYRPLGVHDIFGFDLVFVWIPIYEAGSFSSMIGPFV